MRLFLRLYRDRCVQHREANAGAQRDTEQTLMHGTAERRDKTVHTVFVYNRSAVKCMNQGF